MWHSRRVSPGWAQGKDHCPRLAGRAVPEQPRRLLAFLATRAHCCLLLSLVSLSTHRHFSTKLLSSWSDPRIEEYMGLLVPTCRVLHFPLLNFIRFLFANFSSLSRSFCMEQSHVSITPSSTVSPANMLSTLSHHAGH